MKSRRVPVQAVSISAWAWTYVVEGLAGPPGPWRGETNGRVGTRANGADSLARAADPCSVQIDGGEGGVVGLVRRIQKLGWGQKSRQNNNHQNYRRLKGEGGGEGTDYGGVGNTTGDWIQSWKMPCVSMRAVRPLDPRGLGPLGRRSLPGGGR